LEDSMGSSSPPDVKPILPLTVPTAITTIPVMDVKFHQKFYQNPSNQDLVLLRVVVFTS